MIDIDLHYSSGAIFSEDRKYRYALWRVWDLTLDLLLFVGLNPSSAAEVKNDPTITRNVQRAMRLGYGGLLCANLYAYVSTQPNILLGDGDFVGKETDDYLRQMIGLSKRHLCGWGSFKPVTKRASIVLGMIPEPYCLGVNFDNQPKHPLYVGYDVPMIKYSQFNPKSAIMIMSEVR
jgi:hypothetical protein